MVDCLKQTLKKDGPVRGLYAGTTPAILANVAENSVLFAAYGYCQKFVCHVTGTQVLIKNKFNLIIKKSYLNILMATKNGLSQMSYLPGTLIKIRKLF